jgi:hypothetical protein
LWDYLTGKNNALVHSTLHGRTRAVTHAPLVVVVVLEGSSAAVVVVAAAVVVVVVVVAEGSAIT